MRIKAIVIATVAAGGCSFSSANKPVDGQPIDTTGHDGSAIDAPSNVDAPIDGPQLTFGPAPFTVQLSALPAGPVTLPTSINTDTSMMCSTSASWVSGTQPDACFIVGTTITSGTNTLVATGGRPLVLVATTTITLTKAVDVASRRAGSQLGAGANYPLCDVFPAIPANDASGGGGGAGGTFLTQGGVGGLGNGNTVAAGAAPNAVATPTILRGGCAGQKGGNSAMNAGNAGDGGGAVYVVAGQSISITVGINASGGGATHGGRDTGGSGGGSGGMIVLYAPQITNNTGAVLIANGGGASSGGNNGGNGNDGGDPAMATTPASGGNGPGGDGGHGAILATGGGGGASGNGSEGGGGGGGGGGYIRTNVTLVGAVASPAVDVVP